MPRDIESLLSVIVWPKGIDFSHEKSLIESGKLMFDRLGGRNAEFIFFTRDAVVDGYRQAAETTHWYRGMSKQEFDQLFNFNIVDTSPNSYTGIAPNREYVKNGFFANNSLGTHIVEFGPTLNLNQDEDFSIYRNFHGLGFSLKAEGGGTFGLGDKGSSSARQQQAVRGYGTEDARRRSRMADDLTVQQLSELKTPADIFTEWLFTGRIYRKLVDVRLDARGTARATLDA
jgi:hypothetical protein